MSSFVLWLEREELLTYFVEDIKEINYTACGYYLHRIKLLGLGNISSVKKKKKNSVDQRYRTSAKQMGKREDKFTFHYTVCKRQATHV